MFSSSFSSVQDQMKLNTDEPGYNDIGLSVTTFIASGILLYIIFLGYNNSRLKRHKIFSPFYDVIDEFDSIY
jgi:hypothetical protein